jgi:hypothetical protein
MRGQWTSSPREEREEALMHASVARHELEEHLQNALHLAHALRLCPYSS